VLESFVGGQAIPLSLIVNNLKRTEIELGSTQHLPGFPNLNLAGIKSGNSKTYSSSQPQQRFFRHPSETVVDSTTPSVSPAHVAPEIRPNC